MQNPGSIYLARATPQRVATLGDAYPRYLLRDDFWGDIAAPLASPRTCEPGPGTLTLVQNDGQLSIANGKLVIPAQTTPAWGDLGFYGAAQARVAGRALIAQVNLSTVDTIALAWALSATLNFSAANAVDNGIMIVPSEMQIGTNQVYQTAPRTALAASTDYVFAVVLRATGAFFFVKGGVFTNWTLAWVSTAGNAATVYPAFSFRTGVGTSDYFRVRDLGGAFATDEGIASVNLTTFNQSLSAELVINGNMELPPGGPPANWSAINATLTGAADERTGGAGAQSLDVARLALNFPAAYQQFAVVPGSWHYLDGWRKNIDSSSGIVICQRDVENSVYAGPLNYLSNTSWCHMAHWGRCKGATLQVWLMLNANTAGQHGRFDDISLKRINLNTQQVMPADALVDFAFTLPASPYRKQSIDLCYRISDASLEAGENYWDAKVEWRIDDAAWSLLLNSVLNGTSTNRVAVNDVGTPDTVRVVCQGTKHNCYAKQGSTWTKCGGEVDVSHNDTATGLNVMYHPDITPVSLKAYPRASGLYAELDRL